MAIDENALEPSDYRAICRQTYQYVNELDSNWCTGQVARRNVLLPFGGYDVHFCDDWIVAHCVDFDFKRRMSDLFFSEKNSRHVTEWMTVPRCDLHYTDKNFDICSFQNSGRNFVGIFDRRIDNFTMKINSDDDIICATTLYNDLLGVVYKNPDNHILLRVWRIEGPSSIALMKQCTYVDYDLYSPVSITIDSQFIVVKGYVFKEPEGNQLFAHFISTETLVTRKSLTVDAQQAEYDKGLLYVLHSGHVQIYEISSGTFIHDLPLRKKTLKNLHSEWFLVSANSKYVVIYHAHSLIMKNELNSESTLIYDMEALKNPDADPNSLQLTKIENQ